MANGGNGDLGCLLGIAATSHYRQENNGLGYPLCWDPGDQGLTGGFSLGVHWVFIPQSFRLPHFSCHLHMIVLKQPRNIKSNRNEEDLFSN